MEKLYSNNNNNRRRKRRQEKKQMGGFKIVLLMVMKIMIIILVVSSWWPSAVYGSFVVEESSLTVTSPQSLKGTYQSAIANFGVPQYGGTLAGSVRYSKDKPKACDPFVDPSSFKPSTSQGGRPVIALVDRGDCYFAKKVYNAQQAGAAAVLVADDRDENLLTMDSPEDDSNAAQYLDNITIPSALITKELSDKMKSSLEQQGEMVNVNLDWRESLPHPDERVEYEFWTNSNDECGPKCNDQIEFVKSFKGVAQILEQGGYTLFTPHYITWYCPKAFVDSKQCKAQCINKGRYCAPDPEQDFNVGYDGKQVVMENLRQLCVFDVATNKLKKPWVWWDYVTDFQIRCPMKDKKYGPECAEQVMTSLSIKPSDVRECMGDPELDQDNPILKREQEAQVGTGDRGDVTILPTLVINQRQYRGKLDKAAVVKAICSGYKESTDPPVCLSQSVETNECLTNNGGCWQKGNITACQDTFRGRICVCPLVEGVQFEGDGYSNCQATGPGRCRVDNTGCWIETQGGLTFSACQDSSAGCVCPEGFTGDGLIDGTGCVDVNECSEKTKCQCPQCLCKNTWGSYDCTCSSGLLYIHEHDTCISKKISSSKLGWFVSLVVLVGMVSLGVIGYIIYKYRLRSYMDSEIRAIMAQYMPLDSQNEVHNHMQEDA